ncbi:hypothetical protein LNV09_14605 [Paucibacter sp. B2R-40]|uniref:hypothetical protein n=1 Tax=Paucibacter sp. B2R-40 TaxID=2893554 RepID=UPI0021E387B2|nr:hypothetical protein [Paucibacter sp. B2R-40]MCV2355382.1 hypothetical protein [Paucibacter sp. B2R-40]
MFRILSALVLSLLLAACGDSSPGPLAGTWQAAGAMPLKISFRDGETESMGLIEKVSYKTEGKAVLVTYKDGLMKGTAVRFELVNPTTAKAMNLTYRKVGN